MENNSEQFRYFSSDAKDIVDTLFNTKVFRDNLTRDDLNEIEVFVQYCLQSRFDNHLKAKFLFDKIKNKTN